LLLDSPSMEHAPPRHKFNPIPARQSEAAIRAEGKSDRLKKRPVDVSGGRDMS
jgi:hypothetical protein